MLVWGCFCSHTTFLPLLLLLMYVFLSSQSAYRVQEVNGVLKSDNDEDGEHGAGKQLSHLLEMRQEDQVLVVVSRWFGGILLGPKRFAYITNCARNTLEEYHQQEQEHQTQS